MKSVHIILSRQRPDLIWHKRRVAEEKVHDRNKLTVSLRQCYLSLCRVLNTSHPDLPSNDLHSWACPWHLTLTYHTKAWQRLNQSFDLFKIPYYSNLPLLLKYFLRCPLVFPLLKKNSPTDPKKRTLVSRDISSLHIPHIPHIDVSTLFTNGIEEQDN